MDKKHFVLKYNPPRPTFSADMSQEESAVMQRHFEYWADKQAQGIALVYGPVLDPAGVYGLGIVEVDDAGSIGSIVGEDPAVIANLMRTEYWPMNTVLPERG